MPTQVSKVIFNLLLLYSLRIIEVALNMLA